MVIEVAEVDYFGFHIEHVQNSGWKIVLKDVEFLFPTLQDAQRACRQFRDIVKENRGKTIVPNVVYRER